MGRSRFLVRVAAVLVVVIPLVAVSPASAASWTLSYWGDYNTGTLASRVLTPDGTDSYSFSKATQNNVSTLSMSANPGNTGGNLRQLIWPQNTPDSLDSQSCATWVNASADSVQEGLAMRIVDTPTTTRAVTVTKNVIYNVHWVFNVHTWDTAANPAKPFTQVAQFDMVNAVTQNGKLRPLPWRVCSRIVGNTLDFKIWFPFQNQTEPAWGDPVYSRSATIPELSTWNQPGKTGWYIGHMQPGQSARYNGLTAYSLLP